MATDFPTSLDNFTNPTSSDNLDSPSHSAQHANANDAIEAIETFIGANGSGINDRDEKTTPADADEIGLIDSAASYVLKKLTWANLKATLKTYFDSLTTTLTNKTIDADDNTISNIGNDELNSVAGDIGGDWKSWSPTLTNITIGNGTVVTKYTQIGKTIHYHVRITLGSTSSITGDVNISLPVTISTEYGQWSQVGQVVLRDESAPATYYAVQIPSGAVWKRSVSGSDVVRGGAISATNPFTWANTDNIEILGTYEAA